MTDHLTDDEVKALLDGIAHGDDTLQASMLTARGINAIEAAAPDLARALLEARAERDRLRAERDAWRKGSEAQATEVEALRKERDGADHRAGAMLARVTALDADAEAARARVRNLAADLVAAQAQIEALRGAVNRKAFPILKGEGASVDYQMVADHAEQARANHYQTVERLAERGGLSWCELYAVLHNRKW